MHNAVLLLFWLSGSYVIYKALSFIIYERRHRARERDLGCERPPSVKSWDGIGIGNIRRLMKADAEGWIPQYFKIRTDAYAVEVGHDVSTFYFNVLGSGGIFTVDPKNIQTILATKFKDFGLGEARSAVFETLLGNGIFASDGAQWEHSRALLRPQFARDQVSDLDLEERHVQNMMRIISTNPEGWTETTDLKTLFFRLTFDAATEFLFGASVESQISMLPDYVSKNSSLEVAAKDFAVAFDRSQALTAQAMRLGDGYWLAQTSALKESCRICHRFIDHYVDIALRKEKTGQGKNAGGRYVFLDALAESTRNPLELRYQLLNILLAGRDTTASLLSYLFVAFLQHPEVFKKLRSIILETFGTYENPKEITFSGLKSCSYLQHCLNEALRIYPVVPIDGRRALVDTTLPTGGGPNGDKPVYVRKGQQVDYSVYVMQRRKDFWGPDADVFRPERWIGRRNGWEYLPFNGGPRICIGQQFALTEAGYVTVRLLQRFEEFVGVDNSWESPDKGGVGWMKHTVTLTASPMDGVKVRMKEARA